MKRKTRITVISIAGLLAAVGVLLAASFLQKGTPRYSVTIGTAKNPSFSLIFLAQNAGFFKEQGLNVQFKIFCTGREAMHALRAGEVDLATAFSTVIAKDYIRGRDVRVFAQLHNSSNNSGIVAHKDRVARPEDLAGKKLALVPDTSAGYFLNRFLSLKNIKPDRIQIRLLPVDQAIAAFEEGSVDAIPIWSHLLAKVVREVGADKVNVFYLDAHNESSALVGTSDWEIRNGEALNRVLRALEKAYDFYLNDRSGAFLTLADAFSPDIDAKALMQIWTLINLDMSLSNSMIANLRLEAEHQLGRKDSVSLNEIEAIISLERLRAIRPDLVTYIR